MTLLDSTEKMRRDRVLIEALIDDPSRLGPDYQPINNLADGTLVALKATGRGQSGTELDSTLALLESAQAGGLMERLDWAFRCLAFEVALDHRVTAQVHLTPEPETFGSFCPPRLATAFGRGRRGLTVGAEIHGYGFSHPGLEAAVTQWRGWGWKVIVADVSQIVDPGLLRRLDLMRPDAVQVDLSKHGRETDPPLLELLAWAEGAEVEIHALGVDSAARQDVALQLGAVVGRGRLFGTPGPLT